MAVFALWTEHAAVTGWFLPRMTLSHRQGHLHFKQHHCITASVLSLALFCTPPPLHVSTKEEANGAETVSRVLMAEVNAICLWWPYYSFASSRITCLLPKTKQLRCSFHTQGLCTLCFVCFLFAVIFCMLHAGRLQTNELWTLNLNIWTLNTSRLLPNSQMPARVCIKCKLLRECNS